MAKKKPDNKPQETSSPEKKKVSNPVINEINKFYEENDYSELIQSANPLHILKDKLEKDERGNYKKPANERIINAFYQWRGIKSAVAKSLNCSRPTLDKWIKENKELEEAYQDSMEYSYDHAESKLNELIDGVIVQDYDFKGKPLVYRVKPEFKAIALLLGKSKTRGFNPKTEIEHSGGLKIEPITFNYIAPTVLPIKESE